MPETLICGLREALAQQPDLAGGKGANLARLTSAGLPVPEGFVITTAAYRAFIAANDLTSTRPDALFQHIHDAPIPDSLSVPILDAYQRLGAGAVAVRSSGTAEDLADASFAGQHDTFLNVDGTAALLDAVRACWASLWSPRAAAYREPLAERAWNDRELALAVVVQRMVPAEAAGVAFTANPVTGARDEVTVSAVRGLGERLVSGEAAADEWVVRGGHAVCQRAPEAAITASQVVSVASVARRIEAHFGAPQDIEWALSEDRIFVLQARPMTALPAKVTWTSPVGGGWMRNFRVGEWLPEPVTPLFESWLLARLEDAEVAAQYRDAAIRPRPPYHVTVNGWYFSSPQGGGLPLGGAIRGILRHPYRIVSFALSLRWPEIADRAFLASLERYTREQLLPRYQMLVASWEKRVATASPAELIALIDAVADVAGDYLWSLNAVGGHAWKAERALGRFYREHLVTQVRRSHQELLHGMPAVFPHAPAHAVQSLDWFRPTLGEMTTSAADAGATASAREQTIASDVAERRARMEEQRRSTEAACRAALVRNPRLVRRFERLLAFARRYAHIREEEAGWFTLGWPLLRRAVLRLGAELRQRGAIHKEEDIFFLVRAEVEAALSDHARDYSAVVAPRRREWERQRQLTPPLEIGNPLGARLLASAVDDMRVPMPGGDGPDVVKGMPASPGRASGPARVIRGPDDFDRFQAGEVLVAQVTAPAWTPLFERAVAVVTDGGSLAAHASLVAREYGIPAVVGTGVATTRLRDGQIVEVDGNSGVVAIRS